MPEYWESEYRQVALYDLGADWNIGFVLAYFRSFAVPGIAAVLWGTGEISARPAKRSTDTGVIIYEIIANGFDSRRGVRMVDLLRNVHHGVQGSDDDFLYVLLSLLVVPVRWAEHHAPRPVTAAERSAAHRFYQELGTRIGLSSIPDSYDEAALFFDGYEAANVRPSVAGAHLTSSAMPAFTRRLPRPIKRYDRALLSALIADLRVSDALALPRPGRVLTALVQLALRARRWRNARKPRATEPSFVPGRASSVYPDGYTLTEIGPPPR